MNIYFSGISGTALAPLALLAADAGYQVTGSDLQPGAATTELEQKGIKIHYGAQDGTFLQKQISEQGIDWFVYTSALPKDHPELTLAQKLGLKTTKRDALLSHLISDQHQKLIAVAGTHGKTTTTSMLIWACHQLHIPISYSVGSTLPWAKSGEFRKDAQYFIYEADEYDRNFLHFHPYISIITTEDYDHIDTYPTPADYHAAFHQFRTQSRTVIENVPLVPGITLVGELRRQDASLAFHALKHIYPNDDTAIITALNTFPSSSVLKTGPGIDSLWQQRVEIQEESRPGGCGVPGIPVSAADALGFRFARCVDALRCPVPGWQRGELTLSLHP